MNTRGYQSQIKVYLESDGSVHKEVGPVATESLVFEGGGVRGVGYIGATKALFEAGIMQTVKRLAGTSAGAVTASIVALGYKQADIERILKNNNIEELLDGKRLFSAAKLSKLIRHGFFNNGDKLLAASRTIAKDRFAELIAQYRNMYAHDHERLTALEQLPINLNCITFADYHNFAKLMPESGIKDLYVIAATLPAARRDVCEMKIFSIEHTPHIEVALAVRASVSLPKIFKPVQIDGVKYVDGGCIANFPIHIFDHDAYKPLDTYMYKGHNDQSFSSLGIKIDTEDEVRELMHAPIKRRKIQARIADRMIDKLSGLPICDSYEMNHLEVRENYSHQSSQLGDEGIKSTQFTLTDAEAGRLIQRGYDDMLKWIHNYHQAAIQSIKFSSFQAMCENMDLEELVKFQNEMVTHPLEILRVGGECDTAVAIDVARKLQHVVKMVLKEKTAAMNIIRKSIPELNAITKEYAADLVTLYSRLDVNHEVSDIKKWILSAETAIQMILASGVDNQTKKDDVKLLTNFIDEIKACRAEARPRELGFLKASRKMNRYPMPLETENEFKLAQ